MQEKEFFVHETSIVDEGAVLGKGCKVWHFSHVSSNCELGEGCNLGQNVFVAAGVKLGKNVKVQNNVSLYTGVVCEDDVFLGPSMVFTNVMNPRSAIRRHSEYMETYLERGVTIGANATIVCGTRLGHHCFIGAGTVVTKDVKPYALMVGNPGKQLGWMSEHGLRLTFGDDNMATCSESGEKYQLANGSVTKVG